MGFYQDQQLVRIEGFGDVMIYAQRATLWIILRFTFCR